MSSDSKLLPCPFCEGPANFIGAPGRGYEVKCQHCGAKGGWGDYCYQVEALWNRRPKLTTDGRLIGAMDFGTEPPSLVVRRMGDE